MNEGLQRCRCSLTLKIFIGGVLIYLLISCSLMIPSFRQYTSFQSEYEALTNTDPQVYQCYQICNNAYRYFSQPNLCCNDSFMTLCFTKDECKANKLEDLKNKQKSAIYDIEIGIGITLFCLIVLTIVFRKKYSFLIRQEMERGEVWGNEFNDDTEGNINSSLLKQARNSRVYKSFKEDDTPQDLCVICYQSFSKEKLIKLDCSHKFHKECIRQWLEKKNHCPMCRALA